MQKEQIIEKLKDKDLKVTPQRIIVLSALYSLKNHPTAQQIIDEIHKKNPNISAGTIYKTLDTFTEKSVITKVRSTDDTTRYDWKVDNHHHLFFEEDNSIVDYVNEGLDTLLEEFFNRNKIPNFEIDSIKVHINGRKEADTNNKNKL